MATEPTIEVPAAQLQQLRDAVDALVAISAIVKSNLTHDPGGLARRKEDVLGDVLKLIQPVLPHLFTDDWRDWQDFQGRRS